MIHSTSRSNSPVNQPTTGPSSEGSPEIELSKTIRIAHEVLSYIKNMKMECLDGETMECFRPDLFESGPGLMSSQWACRTKAGLVLDITRGSPSVDTPLGSWHTGIISHRKCASEVKELIDRLKEPLGLEINENASRGKDWGDYASHYNITRWDGNSLPTPSYHANLSEAFSGYDPRSNRWKELLGK